MIHWTWLFLLFPVGFIMYIIGAVLGSNSMFDELIKQSESTPHMDDAS